MRVLPTWRVPGRVRDDPDLPDHVLDAFRITPNDAISIFTIRDVLAREGRELSKAAIHEVCEWLVDLDVLECVSAMGDFIRRYRIVERRPGSAPDGGWTGR